MALDFSTRGTLVQDEPDFSKLGTLVESEAPDTGDDLARMVRRGNDAEEGNAFDNPKKGLIDSIGEFFKPQYKSVLDDYQPTAQEQQTANDQRLNYGAGPIKAEVLQAANEVASGRASTSSPTVSKVAKKMATSGNTFDAYAQEKNTPALQDAARDAKAAEFRSAGEWAIDTMSAAAQGGVSIPLLPLSIFAPGSDLAKTLREARGDWTDQESDVLKAQRAVLKERIENEEGFADKYAATVMELVTNPALGLSEAVKQVPNFLAVMGAARLVGAVAGGAFAVAERSSPALALSNALTSGGMRAGTQAVGVNAGGLAASAVMTSGDAAGDVYESLTDPRKTPKSTWEKNEDYQALIAKGVTHKNAVDQIATAKAQLAAMAVLPLVPFGFMGADAAIASKGIVGLAASFGPKAAAKTFGKEIIGETIEEGGTKLGGNLVAGTVNPEIKWDEGVAEAAATATVTSAPFAALGARSKLYAPESASDQNAYRNSLIASDLLNPNSYDPAIIDPTLTSVIGAERAKLEQYRQKTADIESALDGKVVEDIGKADSVEEALDAFGRVNQNTTQTAEQILTESGIAKPDPAAMMAKLMADIDPESIAPVEQMVTKADEVVGETAAAPELTVPEKGSAVIPSVETGQSMVQRLLQPATPEQEQTQADTVVAEKAKPAPAYTPAMPQPGQAEGIVNKALESARKNADLADERLYSADALQRIAAHPQANAELKAAATNEVQRRAVIEQRKQQQFDAQRSGTVLSLPDAPPLRPLSVERGMDLMREKRPLLPQEQGYLTALRGEMGGDKFAELQTIAKAPFMYPIKQRMALIKPNRDAIEAWDAAHNKPAPVPAQQATQAPQAAQFAAPKVTGLAAEKAAVSARTLPSVKMNLAPAMNAAQAPAAAPTVKQDLTVDAALGVATNPTQVSVSGKKSTQKQVAADAEAGGDKPKWWASQIGNATPAATHTAPEPYVQQLNSVVPSLAPDTNPSKETRRGANSIPTFQGGKTKMARAITDKVRQYFGGNAAKIDTIIDYFGGSGSWGAYMASSVFTNTKSLVIHEYNPERLSKIKLFNERGDKIASMLKNAKVVAFFDKIKKVIAEKETYSGSAIAGVVANREAYKKLIAEANAEIGADAMDGLLQAIEDQGQASFGLYGDGKAAESAVNDILRLVAMNGAQAHTQMSALRARGVSISYVTGDSYQAQQVPGKNVLAMVDPPYYATKGYNGVNKVPIETYNETRKLLDRLRTAGNSVIYTDEAWWEKHDKNGKTDVPADLNKHVDGLDAFGQLRGIQSLMGDFFRMPIASRMEVVGLIDGNQNAGTVTATTPTDARSDARRDVRQDARGMDTGTGQQASGNVAQGDVRVSQGQTPDTGIKASRAPSSVSRHAELLREWLRGMPDAIDRIIRRNRDANKFDYELRDVPVADITPSQSGEDYLNDSSRETARQIATTKSIEDIGRKEDVLPIVLDENLNIIDGNHRHAASTLNGAKTIPAIVRVGPGTGIINGVQAWVDGDTTVSGAGTKRSTTTMGRTVAFGSDDRDVMFSRGQTTEAPDAGLYRYYSARTWNNEAEAKEMIRRRIVEENEQYAGIFKPTDPAIVDGLKFDKAPTTKTGPDKGRPKVMLKQPKASTDSFSRIGNPVDSEGGSRPGVDWESKDMADDGTAESVLQAYGRGKGNVYRAWVDTGDIPAPKGSGIRNGYPEEDGDYDWSELQSKRSAPPPLKLRVGKNGKLVLMDGNHRLAWWRDQGYSQVPAYVIDERPKSASVPFSRQDTTESPRTPASTIRAAITKAYGNLLTRLEGKGLVTLTQTEEEAIAAAAQARADKTGGDVEVIKESLRKSVLASEASDIDVKRSADGNLEGFFDPVTGKSFLIADNLTAESAPATLMHEVGIHMAAEGKFGPMFDRALTVLNDGSLESTEALRRMQESGETSGEEAAAYLVTVYETNRTNAPASVKQWMKDMIAAVRAWLFSKGVIISVSQLTVADIAAVARANARSMARGGPNGGPGGGIRRSFAGEGAATADKMALATARQRVDAGENAETVRKETGWFKGVDGKWRFEVNDSDAKLKINAPRGGDIFEISTLSEVLDHPALFAAYPKLMGMSAVITVNSTNKNSGVFQGYPHERIRVDATSLEKALSLLLHEIQHGIQNIEGFATGGNPDAEKVKSNTYDTSLIAVGKRLNAALDKARADYGAAAYRELRQAVKADGYTINYTDFVLGVKSENALEVAWVIADFAKKNGYADLHDAATAYRNSASEIIPLGYDIKRNEKAFDDYRNLAGEVEARNVQARHLMTPAQRKSNPPNTTQDVPDSDVIVVFNGKDAMSAPSPANADPDIRFSRGTTMSMPENKAPGPQGDAQQVVDIRRSMRGKSRPTQNQRFAIDDESKTELMRRKFQDSFLRVKNVQDSITKQGGTVNELNDVYGAEERMHGIVEEKLRDFYDDRLSPLSKKLADAKLTLDELALYAYAKHAPERNAHIASINDALPDGGSGMTNQEAADILAKFQQEGKATALSDAHKDLMAIGQLNRDEMLNYGLITQAQYDSMSTWKNYVPLRGFEGDEDIDAPVTRWAGRGFNIRGKETMRALGRESRAAELIENLVTDYERTLSRGERNDVGARFLQLVQDNPDPTLWEIDRKMTKAAWDHQNQNVKYTRMIDKADTVAVKVNGKEVYITVKDPLLARALKGEAKAETAGVDHALAASLGRFNSFLRATLTRYNPVFPLKNYVRDVGMGAVSMVDDIGYKGAAKFAKYQTQVWGAAHRFVTGKLDPAKSPLDKMFVEYKAAGGTTGGFYAKDAEQIRSEIHNIMLASGAAPVTKMDKLKTLGGRTTLAIKGVSAVGNVLSHMGELTESVTRFAGYCAAREMGKTPAQAASIAKNMTTNFNRKGEFGAALNSSFLFFNAAVQGSARVVKALKNPKVVGGPVAMMIAAGFMLAGAGGEDDDGQPYWDKIEDYVKGGNLIIMLPPGSYSDQAQHVGTNGRYLKIPMPYGYNTFVVLGYAMKDIMRNQQNDKHGVSYIKGALRVVKAVNGSFNPIAGDFDPTNGDSIMQAMLPTAADVVYQQAKGLNGFNRPTAPRKDDEDISKPDAENVNPRQAGKYAHKIARWLNEHTGGDKVSKGAIDLNPGTIENVVRTTTGGTGVVLADAASLIWTSGDPTVENTARDIPVLRNFYGEVDGVTNVSQMYERIHEAKNAMKLVKADAANGGQSKNVGDEERRLASLASTASKYTKALSTLRKQEININDSDASTAEKRVKAKEIRLQRERLADQFNAIYYQVARVGDSADKK